MSADEPKDGTPKPDIEYLRRWIRGAEVALAHAGHPPPETAPSEEDPFEDMDVRRYSASAAHEATERALKTVLIVRGIEPPRIHDLIRLDKRLEEAGERTGLDRKTLEYLKQFGGGGKYPPPRVMFSKSLAPSVEDTKRFLECAHQAIAWANGYIDSMQAE